MGRVEERRVISLSQPVYAVALSEDGQHIVAGSERGMVVFDPRGEELFTYPSEGAAFPVRCLRMVSNASDRYALYVGGREGIVLRMILERKGEAFRSRIRPLLEVPSDLHSLALSPARDILAVGHLSGALTVVQGDGTRLWRRHPADRTALEGTIWSVAFDGEGAKLFAGSASAGTNVLMVFDALTGELCDQWYVEARVVGLVGLPGSQRVVAVTADDEEMFHLTAYSAPHSPSWERSFEEPVTAIASDMHSATLAVGVGYEGQVLLLDAESGGVRADNLRLRALINDLCIRKRTLVAATQDGDVSLLRYFS